MCTGVPNKVDSNVNGRGEKRHQKMITAVLIVFRFGSEGLNRPTMKCQIEHLEIMLILMIITKCLKSRFNGIFLLDTERQQHRKIQPSAHQTTN